MQRIGLVVAGVLAVLGLAGVIEAQSLRAGQTVRVRLSDGQRFEAKLVGVDSFPSPRSIRCGCDTIQQGAAPSSVELLSARRRSRFGPSCVTASTRATGVMSGATSLA